MMKKDYFDEQMNGMLHRCGDSLEAPSALRTRIEANLEAPAKRRAAWKRPLVACAAAVAVLVTGAAAAGVVTTLASSTNFNDRLSYTETVDALAGMEDAAIPAESFENGFTFRHAYESPIDMQDASGKVLKSVDNVIATYEKDGVSVDLDVHPDDPAFHGEDMTEGIAEAETYTVGDVSLQYQKVQYMFLPPKHELTAEEQKLVDDGAVAVSYGTDTVEYKTLVHISWVQDGMGYQLYSMDEAMDAATLLEMATELITSAE